jgi:energy-coupling factor transporter transmembrane protein EcfT
MVVIEIIISLLIFAVLLIGVVHGLKFLFICLSALFSKEKALQVRKRPIAHAVWSIVGIFLLIFVLLIFNIDPLGIGYIFYKIEKSHQREIAHDRVRAIGGWDILRKDSENILDKYHEDNFRWIKWETNNPPLPDSLTALQPQIVVIDEKNNFTPILQIKLFGMWHTGSEPTPYYGIWITRSNLSSSVDSGLLVSRPWEFLQGMKVRYVTNQIYEVY